VPPPSAVAEPGEAGVSPISWCLRGPAAGGTWKSGSGRILAGCPARGVKAVPSRTHLKDTNNSKVSGSVAQALLARYGGRWQSGKELVWPWKARRIYQQIRTEPAPGGTPGEGGRGAEPWDHRLKLARCGASVGDQNSIPAPITLFIYVITLFLFYRNV